MKVENIMVRDVQTCGARQSIADAARIMWEHDCGSVPIVDEHRRVMGMLTDRDICMAVSFGSRRAHQIRASEPMSGDVFACRATDTIDSAEAQMRKHRVRRLPVIDAEDRLIGILSLNDIVRESVREARSGRRKPEISDAQICKTLAAVCEPRTPRTV